MSSSHMLQSRGPAGTERKNARRQMHQAPQKVECGASRNEERKKGQRIGCVMEIQAKPVRERENSCAAGTAARAGRTSKRGSTRAARGCGAVTAGSAPRAQRSRTLNRLRPPARGELQPRWRWASFVPISAYPAPSADSAAPPPLRFAEEKRKQQGQATSECNHTRFQEQGLRCSIRLHTWHVAGGNAAVISSKSSFNSRPAWAATQQGTHDCR